MALSWNEIKERAVSFSKEWENDFNEDAEAKSFMDAFFNVFGVPRRRVASFEINVKKENGRQGFIDLLWKGNMLIEFKSRGRDLDKAHTQAKDYFPGIKDEDLPKYILVSDFERFRLFDLEDDTISEFKLNELVNNVHLFGFIIGYQKKIYKEQDPANIKAAELMGKLHDRLKEIGYEGHPLEVYLVRLLFCLFAEDTTIFNKQQFQDYITERTTIDGSDLAPKLQELFQVLNTANEKRFKNLDEQLAQFPYVNGKLFEEVLPTASFDTKMRQALLDCCYLDWSKISPAIFGSMFQSVMNPKERRNLGAHYTSETNILKLIKPLFLDDLWREFESVKGNKNKLPEFHKKISQLKFLDPACGCGNFLVITYRELRLLEIDILRATYKNGQGVLDIREIIWLDVDMMGGIEYEEFPARIAEVAMWLIDHQMNMLISNEFGQYFARLPLKKAANIVHGNALQIDWETVIPKKDLSFILGNPPFVGKHLQNSIQKSDLANVFNSLKGTGVLDYVTGWYIKAAKYIQNTKIKVAFVSTSSISQGEQVGVLWDILFNIYKIKIHFAHRTFSWSNEAKGNAAVHCVIVGFANYDSNNKSIFEYENIKGQPLEIKAKNINPYLVEGEDTFVTRRKVAISGVQELQWGSKPVDDGNFLLNETEYKELVKKYPQVKKHIKKYIGADELLYNTKRYCLWLKNVDPSLIKNIPEIKERIENVRVFRSKSTKEATRKMADFPTVFAEIRETSGNFLIIPEVSSELRKYLPIGFGNNEMIISNRNYSLPKSTLYHFGILSSTMHLVWTLNICGRLESRITYSSGIVYNNFPWPYNPSEKQVKAIETAVQKVLDKRAEFPNNSLADLYDSLSMPTSLKKAHNELDKVVDLAYRSQAFINDAKRMEYLFALYEKYTADLFSKEKPKKPKK